MLKHESTRSYIKAVRRANRADRLRVAAQSGKSKRNRVSKQQNDVVRPSFSNATCDCMFEREPDGTINFLGRASDCPGLLPGDTKDIIMGSVTVVPSAVWSGSTDTSLGATDSMKKTPVEVLYKHLEHMTAVCVVHYLRYTFSQAHMDISMNQCETSPELLLSDLPGLENIQAKEIAPIQFWGGPPGHRKLYTGSLLTLLLEQILASNKPELIKRFLTT